IVVVLLCVLSVVSITRLERVNDSLTEVAEDRYPKTGLAAEIRVRTIDDGRQMRALLLSNTSSDIEAAKKRIADNGVAVHQALQELERTVNAIEARNLLKAMNETRVAIESLLEPF